MSRTLKDKPNKKKMKTRIKLSSKIKQELKEKRKTNKQKNFDVVNNRFIKLKSADGWSYD